jgi:protocatechuate 3,4-dioxygenase, beta subunit
MTTSPPQPYARPRDDQPPPYLYPDYGSTAKRAPRRPLIRIEQTPSEVTGPTFSGGWAGPDKTDLTRQHSGEPLGERIILAGRVLDEPRRPVANTLLELWQCNSAGRYVHEWDQHDAPLDPNFRGFGRALTREDGVYRMTTIRPGQVPGRGNAPQAPHILVSVFARGLLKRLVTRIYFEDEAAANAADPVLNSIEDPAARKTLIAARHTGEAGTPPIYRFEIVLQGGENETAFFDV